MRTWQSCAPRRLQFWCALRWGGCTAIRMSNAATRRFRRMRSASRSRTRKFTYSHYMSISNLVLLNQIWIVITLYDDFSTKMNSVWCYINLKIMITIQIWCDLTRFGIDFSVCNVTYSLLDWRKAGDRCVLRTVCDCCSIFSILGCLGSFIWKNHLYYCLIILFKCLANYLL